MEDTGLKRFMACSENDGFALFGSAGFPTVMLPHSVFFSVCCLFAKSFTAFDSSLTWANGRCALKDVNDALKSLAASVRETS